MNSQDIVIVSGARTPCGSFQGSLSSIPATKLGAIALEATMAGAKLASGDADEVIMGCVLPAGLGQGPARCASRQAGISDQTGCTTINKLCGSGMKAVMLGHDLIRAGSASVVLAGGMESMSNAPYLLDKARGGYRMGHGTLKDHMFTDGLEDTDTGRLMGTFAQDTADRYGFSREDMDHFAITSLQRAMKADEEGSFADEIVPVTVSHKKGETVVSRDEQPLKANPEKIPQLRPAFSKDGTITAANSSSISDGAGAVCLMRAQEAAQRGLTPLVRIAGHSTESRHPAEFTIAPAGAIEKLLQKTGWSVADTGLFEINEAFAVVVMAAMREHDLPHDKVNVHGGACALGHPIGASGCRILLTLIHAMRRRGVARGIACLCIGGGEATAIAVEAV